MLSATAAAAASAYNPSPLHTHTQAQQLRAKIVTQDTYDLAGYKQLLDDLRGLSVSQDVCSAYEELVAAFPTAVSVESSSSSSNAPTEQSRPPLGRLAARARQELASVLTPVLTPCACLHPDHAAPLCAVPAVCCAQVTIWSRYVESLMAAGETDTVKTVFGRCLMQCPSVDLWFMYLKFIKKVGLSSHFQ